MVKVKCVLKGLYMKSAKNHQRDLHYFGRHGWNTHCWSPCSHKARSSLPRWAGRFPSVQVFQTWRRQWRSLWSCACVWARSAPGGRGWCRLWACRASPETQTRWGWERWWGWWSGCTSGNNTHQMGTEREGKSMGVREEPHLYAVPSSEFQVSLAIIINGFKQFLDLFTQFNTFRTVTAAHVRHS